MFRCCGIVKLAIGWDLNWASFLFPDIYFMRALTCKQAERWLDKVKEANSSAYKEIGKLLRRYDKYNDEAELFRKMNEVLLSLPELT